jgi:aminoacyl tRNA synthase complex-interacting multifunctional protein 1
MSTALSICGSDSLLNLLYRSFPAAFPPSTTTDSKAAHSSLSLPSGAIQGTNTIASHLSPAIYPAEKYTELQKAEINQWMTLSARLVSSGPENESTESLLRTLNDHLSTRTTLLGSKPSIADAAVYSRLAPMVKGWTAEQQTGRKGHHHIVRFIDFVQNGPVFGLQVSESGKLEIDPNNVKFVHEPVDPREEKERKKKEKAKALASLETPGPTTAKSLSTKTKETVSEAKEAVKGAVDLPIHSKKEKKPKAPKPQKAPAKETPLSPSLIDLRVGHVLKAVNHPNADSLYVSTIACGDPAGSDNTSEYEGQVVRTVCSGLNGLVPLEEMQGRKVVVVCNLKPVKMRGVNSTAMVLACSPKETEGGDGHKGPVELVSPPATAPAGERVNFEGWEGEPEGILNPKKKVWETIQPGFTSSSELEVVFDNTAVEPLAGAEGKKTQARLVTLTGDPCLVKSLIGGTVR